MIYKSRQIATSGGIDDGLMIEPKHVNTRNPRRVVALFAMISNRLANNLAHILDDKLLGRDRLHCEQSPTMNVRFGELERLFAQLELRELEHLVDVIVGGDESTLE